LKPRKRFGQNFLHDQQIINHIIAAIAPKKDQYIVEIGPGFGALTKKLLPLAGSLDAIELDRDLIPKLQAACGEFNNFTLHSADALTFNFKTLLQNKKDKLRVVGNLPYNISTPLLFHLLKFAPIIHDMYFMLQKEVVDRLAAQVGEPAYGRLGIMVQYFCKVEKLFEVPPTAFNPKPKVTSAIVKLTPYAKPPYSTKNFTAFSEIVKTAFSQRRKTLRNALKSIISEQKLKDLNIDPSLRPEKISLSQFVKISSTKSLKPPMNS
jgi:16S rRNA (adenine1518-N6/adenine1519-N6)-dimethyltransferase